MMIDQACGFTPRARQVDLTKDQRDACQKLADDVLSNLRTFYPGVVKTRPTTWPKHLRNTIAAKAELLLMTLLEESNSPPPSDHRDSCV